MARITTFSPASIYSLRQGRLQDPRTPGLMIEVLPSGRKVWKYERRLDGYGTLIRLTLGRFPTHTMSDAREWAAALNDQVETGIDPREVGRAEEAAERAREARQHDRGQGRWTLRDRGSRRARFSCEKAERAPYDQRQVGICTRDIAPMLSCEFSAGCRAGCDVKHVPVHPRDARRVCVPQAVENCPWVGI